MSASWNSIISSLYQKSPIEGIHWDTEHHTITIGRVTIELTTAEYQVLFSLRHGAPMTYAHLVRAICSDELDGKAQMRMEKCIESLRTKLHGSGICVYCVVCYGYILLPELPPEKERKQGRHTKAF